MFARICLFSTLFLLGLCSAAGQGSLAGPSLGIFYDPGAQAIRPIWGIPGASMAGQPIDVGFPIASAVVSPSQDYALGVSGDGSIGLIKLGANGSSAQVVPGGLGMPDRIVLSPAGKSAGLYYSGSTSVQILAGLPDSPQFVRLIDLSMLPNAPDVFAISDDGSLLLTGVRENADGAPAQGEVFALSTDSPPRSIATLQHASAIAFLVQSHDALLADDIGNSVTLVQDAAAGAGVVWMFTGQQLLPAPDSVQASSDRQSFLAGSSRNGLVAILDSNGSNPVVLSCGCAPTEFRPLSTATIYQITEPASGLLWIVNSNITSPGTFFVPIPNGSNPNSSTTTATDGEGRK
jgi:hypothetical protein